MNIIHSKMVKFINAITSHDARENDATQTSEVSKYQIISQPKLDKFQLQCTANVRSDGQNSIMVAETHVYMKASSGTNRQRGAHVTLWRRTHVRCPSNLISKRKKSKNNNITP